MKPTFQNDRPVRRGESLRPAAQLGSKSPVTDWNFQSTTADLRGTASPSRVETEPASAAPSFYGLSQAIFAAETKWDDRIEAVGLLVVIAIAACPIAQAIYIAARTV